MELSFENIKQIFEKYGYYAEDELIWQTYINVDKIINNGQVGQNIHAICLEGPPGAGKTEYAKVYTKLLADILGEKVSLIDYQCDSTTGKADLYEEIRVSAAIVGNPDEVIISGKLVEAIDEVNSGKKLVLFLDEYDKAREETDTLLLKFLQEGRINTTQRGNVEIFPENMKNLQCIICRNQMREELSGPLERRLKILRLSEMKPEVFYKVAKRQLPDADKDVLNVVSVLYGALYENKDNFARIPSCSENLMAIKDACTLMKANAPEEFIYSAIISNMLKNPDDIETFRHLLGKDERLAEFFKKSCNLRDKISDITPAEEMRRRMLSDFFSDDITRVSEDIKRANRMLTDVHIENDFLEEKIQAKDEIIAQQESELQRKDKQIVEQQAYLKKLLQSIKKSKSSQSFSSKYGGLFKKNNSSPEPQSETAKEEQKPDFVPTIVKISDDYKFIQQDGIGGEVQRLPITEVDRFKPNQSIFEQSQDAWQNFGYISIKACEPSYFSEEKMKKNMRAIDGQELSIMMEIMRENPMAKLYKDGFLLFDKDDLKIGIIRVEEKVNRVGEKGPKEELWVSRYKLFANQLVLPIYALEPLRNLFIRCYTHNMKNDGGTYLECLVSAEEKKKILLDEEDRHLRTLKDRHITLNLDPITNNTYHLQYENYYDNLQSTGSLMAEKLFNREYDDYMKAELFKIARSMHRELLQTGKLNPTPTEFIKPLVAPESPADDGREL